MEPDSGDSNDQGQYTAESSRCLYGESDRSQLESALPSSKQSMDFCRANIGANDKDGSPTGANVHSEKILRPQEFQKFLAWTLVMCRKIREQPVFSAEARVYRLDSKTHRRPWIELSSKPVDVHFYNDAVRRTYRVLCVEGNKPLINCSLTPSIVVTRTSAKFAQWLDSRSNTVYGFGFQSEGDVDKFLQRCRELQSKIQRPEIANTTQDTLSSSSGIGCSMESAVSVTGIASLDSDQLLRMEIEQLKAALADSSLMAKLWGDEFEKIEKQNGELKTVLEAMTLLIVSRRWLRAQQNDADPNHGEPTVGTSVDAELSDLANKAAPLLDLIRSANADPFAVEQLRHLIGDSTARVDPRNGLKHENGLLTLEVQKAIGEKLSEALTLHGLLTRLLE